MKYEIEITNGIKYLKGIDGNKKLEIADYIEIHESSLFMVGVIVDKKEYFQWGKNHVKYTKLWGCIDSMMNIVVPFIFQHMKREFNYIDAEIEENGIIFPDYRHYYFNLFGVLVIYSKKKKWQDGIG